MDSLFTNDEYLDKIIFVRVMYKMPTKKKQYEKKSRSNKKQRRRTQKHSEKPFFIGGTCSACGACMNRSLSFPGLRGGKNYVYQRSRGGNDNPPSFDGQLPQRYFYSENNHNQDPNNPSMQVASRQAQSPALSGGISHKKKPTKKGGFGVMNLFNGTLGTSMAFNPMNTMGDSATSQLPSAYISGNIQPNVFQNPSILSQPVDHKYNEYIRPLA